MSSEITMASSIKGTGDLPPLYHPLGDISDLWDLIDLAIGQNIGVLDVYVHISISIYVWCSMLGTQKVNYIITEESFLL